MKEYQNRRKQFGSIEQSKEDKEEEDDDEQKESSNTDVLCNVCLSNQDDFLGFPCLLLPTTLPSIFANKFHNNEVPPSSYVKTYDINICSHHIHYNCYKQLLQQNARKMSVDEIMSLKTQFVEFVTFSFHFSIRSHLLKTSSK
ncbi:hypothetical protein M9Y10_027848 [Tritrichomonas musculus]|uniref:RING-type E3 ubiquitin transferase n=1 Tax=Tritrichomonas musculus TaxID=1915356 RepID=A0ABR2H5A3_9EUKA